MDEVRYSCEACPHVNKALVISHNFTDTGEAWMSKLKKAGWLL